VVGEGIRFGLVALKGVGRAFITGLLVVGYHLFCRC
jgi:hypothetical protein